MKKSIIASMFAGIIISTAGMAEAACDIWFDRGADIDRFQKVVVYPISAKSRNNFLWKNEGLIGTYNYELHKRLNRHVKGITFYELAEMIDEKEKVINVDTKKNKHKLEKNKKAVKKLKFGNIDVPNNLGSDEYLLKSLWFAYKEEAYKMKKVEIVPEDSLLVDYIVKMSVSRNEYIPYWTDPYATCDTKVAWTKKYKWTDKDGNEHEGEITHYEPGDIRNVYGHYNFNLAADVSATMYLYDAHTNQLLYSKYYTKYNDKFADAYRDIFKDFYQDVNKLAEGKLKT